MATSAPPAGPPNGRGAALSAPNTGLKRTPAAFHARSDASSTNGRMSGIGGPSASKKKKKLVIKPFKVAPKLPDAFEQETWRKLETAIHAVHHKQTSALSREELYRSVEDLCTWKMAPSLYKRLEETCAEWIQVCVDRLQQQSGASEDVNVFLEAVHRMWEDHCDDMLVIRTIFMYLDRTYVVQTPHVASIWELGLTLLRKNLSERTSVEHKLIQALLELIERERKGEAINRSYPYDLLRMLLALQLYHAHFETQFIEASERFYTDEGVQASESSDVPQFLLHVEQRLREERERIVHFLDASTQKQLIHVVETKLLQPHTDTLLERGFAGLMDSVRVDDLRRMFVLFGRVNALPNLKAAFSGYIKTKVSALVMDVEQEKNLVEKLLHLQSDLESILHDSFQSDTDFAFALKSAMEDAVNVRPSRPAELVAKYVDAKLRTGNKGGSESDVETVLDRVMIIFRYIQGKDVFEAFYKKDLAKRLLVGKSASFDLEKLMLSKLKTECGSSFTNKLEGMFKDIDLSGSVMRQFQEHAPSRVALENLGKGHPEMHVQVLTTGFWPPYVAMDVVVPKSLVPLKEIFETFYSSKYQGRQLQWQHSLANCVVRARFPSGKKELVVSLFQTVVLLCFNGTDQVSFRELVEQTRIEDGELRRTLQSLACGKTRVLHKRPKGREVLDDDVFLINSTFTSQLFRIKINSIQLKETRQENEDTHERVFRDRQYQVDAAIVRIMKARKTLQHQSLMTQIFEQVRFPAKAADIKRRIESLIDREYLERDPKNPQMYNYLA